MDLITSSQLVAALFCMLCNVLFFIQANGVIVRLSVCVCMFVYVCVQVLIVVGLVCVHA